MVTGLIVTESPIVPCDRQKSSQCIERVFFKRLCFSGSLTIILNRGTDPLFGQFIGLDQGASLFAGNHQFSVDYFGGNGHDFVLSVVPEPSAAILLAVAVMGCGLLRRRPPAN